MTSVLIIDDHPIVLQGCRRVLEDAGMEPVLTASDLVAGYRLYRRHQPDVVVVDLAIQGKGLGGLDLIRRIRTHNPRAHILVLSMHNDAMIVARSLEAGASGYVLKDTSSEQLVKAVQQVANGVPYLDGVLDTRVALIRSGGVRRNQLGELIAAHAARTDERHLHGKLAVEIRHSVRDLLHRFDKLFRRGVLEHIAGCPRLQRTRHDHRVIVHAEHQDVRARIVSTNAADEIEAAEALALDGEVDDDNIGSVAAIEPVAGDEIAGGQHRFHAGVFEHPPAPLQHDGMIIDDENRGHG